MRMSVTSMKTSISATNLRFKICSQLALRHLRTQIRIQKVNSNYKAIGRDKIPKY